MKKGNVLVMMIGALYILGSVSCTYYTNPNDPEFVIPPPAPAYIGSESCQGCHSGVYETFIASGHPYIHSKVEEATAPVYPNTSIDFVPPYFANGWQDISYVIGGFAWKYHFTDADGYIYTGDDAQYNFQTSEAVPFHETEAPGTKTFTCGKCHTTGWVSTDNGGSPKDDLPGMGGDYFAGGVQCEACHGMGSVHASTQSPDDIVVNSTAAFCGECHSRNEGSMISAKNGFIDHNAQFDELQSAAHKALDCVSCHDPHISVQHGSEGVIVSCTECHSDLKNPTHRGADCITCHMSQATYSATTTNKYVGDVNTHIFKINPAADGKMFNDDGTVANGETGVTLGYVCYQCHRDSDGIGGDKSEKSLSELSATATGFHD